MKFILGKKIGMSQIFNEEGEIMPVTLIEAGPCVVLQIKDAGKDGYSGAQLGFAQKKKISRAQIGHIKKAVPKELLNKFQNIRWIREFRFKTDSQKPESGSQLEEIIDVSAFSEGDKVSVSGLSKGKGFQGVIKRHGFRGGPKSHGQKHSLRAPGSIGSSWPERVAKGKRMAGRMGNERVTVKNLEVIKIDKDNNLLAIKGAVPGRKGTLLEIKG